MNDKIWYPSSVFWIYIVVLWLKWLISINCRHCDCVYGRCLSIIHQLCVEYCVTLCHSITMNWLVYSTWKFTCLITHCSLVGEFCMYILTHTGTNTCIYKGIIGIVLFLIKRVLVIKYIWQEPWYLLCFSTEKQIKKLINYFTVCYSVILVTFIILLILCFAMAHKYRIVL